MTKKPIQHGGRRDGAGRPPGKKNKRENKARGSWQRCESLSELTHRMSFFYQIHQEDSAKGSSADSKFLRASLDRAGKAAAALLPSNYFRLRSK